MGYGAVSIVMYGVAVSEDVAEQLYERFTRNEAQDDADYDDEDNYGEFKIPGAERFIFYRRLGDYSLRKGKVQRLPITPYAQHAEDGEVFYPTLVSEGADSRVDSMDFNPGFDHYIGIFIASKGYGHSDKTNYFLNALPPEAVTAYEKGLAPILAEFGIDEAPTLLVTQQTW